MPRPHSLLQGQREKETDTYIYKERENVIETGEMVRHLRSQSYTLSTRLATGLFMVIIYYTEFRKKKRQTRYDRKSFLWQRRFAARSSP